MNEKFFVSILSSNLLNIENSISSVPDVDGIHIDIMDNHFVPNIGFSLNVVKQIKLFTDKDIDCHLMINNPETFALSCAEIGVKYISFHIEACAYPLRLLENLKKYDVQVGIALNPFTSINIDLLLYFDYVLLMTVEPGFGGQKFIKSIPNKINNLYNIINQNNKSVSIQVDGGVDIKTAPICHRNGARMFVLGSSVYSSGYDNANDKFNNIRDNVLNINI